MTFSLKFFPFKDFIFSIVPTVASFEGYIQDLIPLPVLSNKYIELGVGLLISIILALIFHKGNVRNYKKSLAEILATGYMNNFTGRLGRILKGKSTLTLSFPDQSVLDIKPEDIKVNVALPKSFNALRTVAEKIEGETDIVYIREASMAEPFWVRGTKEENGGFTIYEFPRTLFALPKYLKKDFPDIETSDKNSRRIFNCFNDKIEQLCIEYSQDLPQKQFIFEKS